MMYLQVAKYARTTSESAGSRRALGSSVGAVLQHDNNEEEEEYDPRRPAIGNVASVIKVTERRSDQNFTVQHVLITAALLSNPFQFISSSKGRRLCC